MKWIYRFFTLAILVTALAVPFFINNKDDQPMLELPTVSNMLPASSRAVYKWQDAQGVLHYGDTPPANNAHSFEKMEVSTNTNIIQGFTPPVDSEPETEPAATPPTVTDSNADGLSLARLKNIMTDARSAAQLMEQRNVQLKQIAGDK